jgi:dethiobiotin synthetase
MSAFFVTATGTDIGKTFVTAGLLRDARRRGLAARAVKPVVSGFTPETAAASDPGLLLAAMGEAVTPDTLDRTAPWRFSAPLSPDMAAAREGRSIEHAAVVRFCRHALKANPGTLFIEGVGGVMVPLDRKHTVLDWMAALGLPLVLVAGSYLGAMSHTLTALDAVAHRGLKVAALVINETGDGAVPLDETVAVLRRFTAKVPIATLHRVVRPGDADADFARLWTLLGEGG